MERNREITVKGVGSIKASVDLVVVKMTFENLDKDYRTGYESFCQKLSCLQEKIVSAGFKKNDVKTSRISITTEHERLEQGDSWKYVFQGYKFETRMSLSFDFDSQMLVTVLGAIADSGTQPRIDIEFTVKDKEAVKNALLESAAKAAKTKAEILCSAMGVKLGKLMTILYNWSELEIYSRTEYMHEQYLNSEKMMCCVPDFTPDDIDLEDDATFVWEICG